MKFILVINEHLNYSRTRAYDDNEIIKKEGNIMIDFFLEIQLNCKYGITNDDECLQSNKIIFP